MTLLSENLSILLNLATTLAGNTNQVKHKTSFKLYTPRQESINHFLIKIKEPE